MRWREAGALKRLLMVVAAACAAVLFGLFLYLMSYSHPGEHALGCISGEVGQAAEELDGALVFFPPEEKDTHAGLVLYPAGKVDYRAYAPLAQACSERGVTCVIVGMPANIPFLGAEAASNVIMQLPDVREWYVGGHAAGGRAAAVYASGHVGSVEGLVLLASYSPQSLSSSDLRVLSVRGSLDGVLDEKTYWSHRSNIESNGLFEAFIDGGNHSQFGCYGLQRGDSPAGVSEEEQIKQTAEAIFDFISEKGSKPVA